jgi:hypothetical protein
MNNLKRRLQTGEPGTSNEPPPGRPSSRGIPVRTNGPPSGGDAFGWGEEGNGIGGPRPNDSSFSPPVISGILYGPAEMPLVDFLPRVGSKALAFGNTQSCNAQGFCTTFGIATMFSYDVMLCVYYAFALAAK